MPGAVRSKLMISGSNNWDSISIGPYVIKTTGSSNIDITLVAKACATDTGTGVWVTLYSL